MTDKLTAYIHAYDNYQTHRAAAAKHGGAWVKAIREASGMSVNKYAAVLGVTASLVSRIERGDSEVLSPDLARKILAKKEAQQK